MREASQSSNNAKRTAQRIFRQTLAAIDIAAALDKALARRGSQICVGTVWVDLDQFREVVAISFGKAAFAMAESLTDILAPEYRPHGILVPPEPPPRDLPGWNVFVGGHPVPNEQSFAAGRAILDRLTRCNDRTLVIFLISGGGSAMVDQPLHSSVNLEDFQELHAALVTCGAPIEEINAVRKHLSATKGGRLAAAAPNSMKLSLAISDVPQGLESAIASGPTLPDPTTIADVERIAREYKLLEKLPAKLRSFIEKGELRETPKEQNPGFALSHFKVLLGEHDLTHAAHRICESMGYVSVCDNSTDGWAIDKASDHLLAQLEAHKKANSGKPVAVISDGEVSSPVTGNGLGGRNSAFVLACVPKIAGSNITVLSIGTDGIDGISPAAGAVADGSSLSHAHAANLDLADYQRRSDSYSFFAALGDAIVTGPTGINLRDLRVFLMA